MVIYENILYTKLFGNISNYNISNTNYCLGLKKGRQYLQIL